MRYLLLPFLLFHLPLGQGAEYGAADYFPSETKPVMFMADGNGHYPGATPPIPLPKDPVVWSRELPAGMAAPLVVGEKVFVQSDPWILTCVNVHDGSVIWQRDFAPWHDMPEPMAKAMHDEWTYYEACHLIQAEWRVLVKSVTDRAQKAGIDTRKNPVLLTSKQLKGKDPENTFAIDDADFQQDLKRIRQAQKQLGLAYHRVNNDGFVHDQGVNWSRWRQRMRIMFNFCTWNNWYGFLTWTYNTPVCDGERIYVPGVCNQMSCFNLDGKLLWSRWVPTDNGGTILHTRYVKSPLLSGDTLLWRGDSYLTAFDKYTGAVRWRHRKPSRSPVRPDPESGQMALMQLTLPDQTRLPIVIDPQGAIHRVADGKVLGHVKGSSLYRRHFLSFDDVLIGRGKDSWGKKLTAVDADTVTVTQLWKLEKTGWVGVAYGNKAYISGAGKDSGAMLIDPRTGPTGPKGSLPLLYPYGWNVVAGHHNISWKPDRPGGQGSWAKKERYFQIHSLDFRTGTSSKSRKFVDRPWSSDDAWIKRWCHRGTVDFIATGHPTPQANRIFFRSIGTLWCLGDKTMAFPVQDSWPAAARASSPAQTDSPYTFANSHAKATGAARSWLARAGKGDVRGLIADVLTSDPGMAINAGWALAQLGPAAKNDIAAITTWLTKHARRNRNQHKEPVPHTRLLAASLAVGGIHGIETLVGIRDQAWGPGHTKNVGLGGNRNAITYAIMMLHDDLTKSPDRPFALPVAGWSP